MSLPILINETATAKSKSGKVFDVPFMMAIMLKTKDATAEATPKIINKTSMIYLRWKKTR